ncbi:uncharacterized protein LOC121054911 [Oryza brachyantha]|uniref:uncharacterized protein LOC121054911 n=1 Tax=Oryza brachyantha TaxID=4533 RepID=UPI001AD9689B|nr:uncharacterized protein LOC121054911 [Oryza brachyantha]
MQMYRLGQCFISYSVVAHLTGEKRTSLSSLRKKYVIFTVSAPYLVQNWVGVVKSFVAYCFKGILWAARITNQYFQTIGAPTLASVLVYPNNFTTSEEGFFANLSTQPVSHELLQQYVYMKFLLILPPFNGTYENMHFIAACPSFL